MKKLLIASFKGGYSGVLQYRWQQPLEQLMAKGHRIVALPDITDKDDPDYEAKLNICSGVVSKADVLFMLNPGFLTTYQMLYDIKRINPKLKLVADFDDDQFNISPFNGAYKYSGRREVKYQLEGTGEVSYKDKKEALKDLKYEWLWKHGVDDFNVKRNRNNAKATAAIIGMLDLMFTTTERLKFKYRHYLDKSRIVVVPNGINYQYFDKYEKPLTDGRIRIVWPLSSSHLPDWYDIVKTLGKVLRSNKNCVLVTLGEEMNCGRDIPLSQHEHIGWADDYPGYLYNLFTCGADIGICPLISNRFNWKKSPLKWEEMSSIRIPSVVSNVMYGDYVKDGETGLVYNSHKEFEEKLQTLIDSAELRKSIGEKAYTEVRENYNIVKLADRYESSLEKLCGTQKIIEVVK